MKKDNVQGLSIALVDDQEMVWTRGFGYADVKKKIPSTPETVYPVGSIAKLFTIIAALQLAEQNKIDIDQSLQTYLPEFSIKTRFPDSGPITPRTMMTHHSGLPSDWLKEMMSRNPSPFTDLAKELKDEYTVHPPNFIFSYSNLAMRLLGHVVENVSGQAFVSYLDESVLRPMGMTKTSFVPQPDLKPCLSKGYKDGKETEEWFIRDLPSPDGPLYATVIDLSYFMQMIFANGMAGNQRILKPETLAEMFRPQNSQVPLDLDFRIGLGWFLNDIDLKNAGLVASHGGALPLFYSQLAILPEHKLGVVVLANSSTGLRLVNKVAEKALKLALAEKTGMREPNQEKSAEVPLPLQPQMSEEYTGHYAAGLKVFTVRAEGKRLYTRLMGRDVQLVPDRNGLFFLQYRLFGLIPIKIRQLEGIKFSLSPISGRKVLVLHHQGKRHLLGEKIEENPIPDVWLRRVGAYELINPGNYFPMIENATLRYEDRLLILDVTMPILGDLGAGRLKFAIAPLSDTEAIILGLGRNMGETIHVVHQNGEERIRYSGCEFRRKSE